MKGLMMTLAVGTAAVVLGMPEPAAWYRVDQGLTTVENGKVVKWANAGSLGATLDLAPAVEGGDDIILSPDAFGKMPAVRFPGSNYLGTAAGVSTDFGITAQSSGNAVFLVAWSVASNANSGGSRRGFYGLYDTEGTASRRFCAFYAANGANTVLRTHDYGASGANSYVDTSPNAVGSGTVFLSRTLFLDGSARKVSVFLSGRMDKEAVAGPSAYVPWASEFRLGHNGLSWGPGEYFDGYIAEFRIYNTALTAAERYQVECELAAKYSLELKPDADTTLAAGAILACTNAATVLGTQPHGGAAAAAIATEGTSGNLTVAFGTAPASGVNTLLYVANNGEVGEECVYGLAGAAAARAVPLTLTFADAFGRRNLFHRDDTTGEWRALDVEPCVEGASCAFTLPAGWENGQYALARPTVKPAVWFRADRGVVTNANGKVTGWKNAGSLGITADLTNSLDEASHITVGELGGQPALAINHSLGLDFLVNDTPIELGVTTASGCAYFGVFKTEDVSVSSPFGIDFGGSPRFGFQTAKTWNPRVWYAQMFGNGSGRLPYEAGEQLLGANGWRSNGDWWNIAASNFGDTLNYWANGETAKADLSKPGRLLVGGFIQSWGAQMFGRIAEVRIYNRALTAQEYAGVELELAARYGMACADATGADTVGCMKDCVAFGRDAHRGANPVVTVTNATCGALSIALGAMPSADVDSLVRVGRDAGDGAAAEWCIAAGSGARNLPVTLTFTGPGFRRSCNRLRRLDNTGAWQTVGGEATLVEKGVSFTLLSGWESGRYKIELIDGTVFVLR